MFDTERDIDRNLRSDLGKTITIGDCTYTNLSSERFEKVLSWIPAGLKAEEVIAFPDVCPGKSPLPTGLAVKTFQPDWRQFAVSDCGCGMQLLKSKLSSEEFSESQWDRLGIRLTGRKGQLGDLGGGNHFIDALTNEDDGRLYFLIHTGSRLTSGLVDHLIDKPKEFDRKFLEVVKWARDNRDTTADFINEIFGDCELVWDKPHNTFSMESDDSVIIRKGAVHVNPDEPLILPSSMTGDVAILKATKGVNSTLNSLSHGTGRTIARGEAKELAESSDIEDLRQKIYIPPYIKDHSLRSDLPHAYRPLNDCLRLLNGCVEEVARLSVRAYLGHLPS